MNNVENTAREIPLLLLHLIQVTFSSLSLPLSPLFLISQTHHAFTLCHTLPLSFLHTLSAHKHQAESWLSLAACLFLRMFSDTTLKEHTISSAFPMQTHEALHADTSDESHLEGIIKVMTL